MLHYLEKKIGIDTKPLSNHERIELTKLQNESEKLKNTIKQLEEDEDGEGEEEDEKHNDAASSEGEDEEDDFVEDIPQTLQQKFPKFRTSVSSEAFGIFNKKENFKARVIVKDEDTKFKIRNRLGESFMFANLDPKDLKIVIDAMDVKKYNTGETIIKQGDDGDELFLVGDGKLDCHIVAKTGGAPTFIKFYTHGDVLGELALLYNAPRAATIKAVEDSILYSLDRSTFNNIVKEGSAKRRNEYEIAFKKVKILSNMENYERQKLADAIQERKYKNGDIIIKEGDIGEDFFMITEGKAKAMKKIDGKQKEVMKYEEGSYFGEIALLKNEPRAATVIAETTLKVVYLDRKMFGRLLGPLEEILKRNMSAYSQYTG